MPARFSTYDVVALSYWTYGLVPGTNSTNGIPWIGCGFSKAISRSLDFDFILSGEVADRFVPRIFSISRADDQAA